MASPHQILDPMVLARLESLELVARAVVEGFLRGPHRGPHRGSSVEFAEHRPYVPGDDISNLDWRSYAKTDRFFLKQYEDETNLRATLLVDASASMAFGSGGVPRFRYAQCLAAALGHLLARNLDAVGLVLFGDSVRRHVPPRSSAAHLAGLLGELERSRPEGETSLGAVLRGAAERVERRGLVILISDLLDDPREILQGLARFRGRDCEVIVLQLLDAEELDFPFTRWTVFRDPERPSVRLRLDARAVRTAYLAALTAHREELRRGCGALRIDFAPIDTRTPFHEALVRVLSARKRRGGGW